MNVVMRQSGRILTTALVLGLSVSGAARAGNAVVTQAPLDAERLASCLGIQHISRDVVLPQAAKKITVRLEFFKRGQFVEGLTRRAELNRASARNRFNVSILISDPSQIRIGDTPADHLRFGVRVEELESHDVISATFDLPKSEVATGSSTATGNFTNVAARDSKDLLVKQTYRRPMEIPIASYIRADKSIVSGETPEETVRQNPAGLVMIVYLVYAAE